MAKPENKGHSASSRQEPLIVAAVDFSSDSKAALAWAGEYAGHTGAKLLLLHVVHDPGDAPGSYRKSDQDHLRPMEDVADKLLVEFLQEVKADNPALAALNDAEVAQMTGIPATRILEFAQTHGAQLIVIGNRGRTGLPHLLLGSTSQRVAQLSPIPVTIVKAEVSDD